MKKLDGCLNRFNEVVVDSRLKSDITTYEWTPWSADEVILFILNIKFSTSSEHSLKANATRENY